MPEKLWKAKSFGAPEMVGSSRRLIMVMVEVMEAVGGLASADRYNNSQQIRRTGWSH